MYYVQIKLFDGKIKESWPSLERRGHENYENLMRIIMNNSQISEALLWGNVNEASDGRYGPIAKGLRSAPLEKPKISVYGP